MFLAYRLPREPSTPRISLWRKLRRLGAVQLLDGLVVLPAGSRNREQFEWLADEVLEAAGEASVWVAQATSVAQEQDLIERMAGAVAEEYRTLAEAARAAAGEEPGTRRRTVARLRRELRRIRQRDYFPPPEREGAERAVEGLAATVEVSS